MNIYIRVALGHVGNHLLYCTVALLPDSQQTDVLKSLRITRGKTQQQVAEAMGITLRSYSDLERGINQISQKRVEKLAEFYGLSSEGIWAAIRGKKEPIASSSIYPVRHLPFASLSAQAGFQDAFIPQDSSQYWDQIGIPEIHKLPEDAFVIEVAGDSMTPRIQPRDQIVVSPIDPGKWADLPTGKIYLVCFGDSLVVKRIRNRIHTAGEVDLISDNTLYEPQTIPLKSLRQIFKVHLILSRVD